MSDQEGHSSQSEKGGKYSTGALCLAVFLTAIVCVALGWLLSESDRDEIKTEQVAKEDAHQLVTERDETITKLTADLTARDALIAKCKASLTALPEQVRESQTAIEASKQEAQKSFDAVRAILHRSNTYPPLAGVENPFPPEIKFMQWIQGGGLIWTLNEETCEITHGKAYGEVILENEPLSLPRVLALWVEGLSCVADAQKPKGEDDDACWYLAQSNVYEVARALLNGAILDESTVSSVPNIVNTSSDERFAFTDLAALAAPLANDGPVPE